jgi:crotonobetainyl-CoA:carnitine CoA-transferase CaiB-like acyl-CoA transferase
MMRMPGFGLDGPWRDKPAFAYVIEDAVRDHLADRTSRPEPRRTVCGRRPERGRARTERADACSRAPERTGEGVRIEAAMVDAALNVAGRAGHRVLRPTATAATPRQSRTDRRTAEPVSHVRTDEFGRPDDWVAIAVATDEQWASLVAAPRRTRLGHR